MSPWSKGPQHSPQLWSLQNDYYKKQSRAHIHKQEKNEGYKYTQREKKPKEGIIDTWKLMANGINGG